MFLALGYYLKCFACGCRKLSFKSKSQSVVKHMQLEKGKKKLYRDLDIVNLLNIVKDYSFMK